MRIASLLPAATEIVLALGLGHRLAAVTFECAAEARARCPVVVDTAIPAGLAPAEIDAWVRGRTARGLPMYELDRAALAAADPDLILTQDLCRVCALPAGTVADACRAIGTDAEVLSLDPHGLDDVLDAVLAVGRAAGAARTAEALVGGLRARLAAVEVAVAAVAGRSRPRMLVLEWTDPPSSPGTGCRSWYAARGATRSVRSRAAAASPWRGRTSPRPMSSWSRPAALASTRPSS